MSTVRKEATVSAEHDVGADRSIDWRLVGLGVVVAAALLFFSRLGARALWSSECRWAEITRELAAILLFLRNEKNPAGWWVVLLWTVMALTSLTKGLLGFALPLVVIGTYAMLADGWKAVVDDLLRVPITRAIRRFTDRNR